MRSMTLVYCVALVCWFASSSRTASGAEAKGTDPELALLYDFYAVEGAEVNDWSGHGHAGRLEGGEIVLGRRKPAVRFSGNGLIATDQVAHGLDPAGRALTVGAMINPGAENGVVISMGDAQEGFSLYLRDGVPHFAVRANGALSEVAAPAPAALEQWLHLVGVIGASGEVQLLVNTSCVASVQGRLIAHTPREPLTVGADPGSPVGEYAAPLNWRGLVEDVRLYWGAVGRENNRDLLADWADRHGRRYFR